MSLARLVIVIHLLHCSHYSEAQSVKTPPADSIIYIKGVCKNLFISSKRYEIAATEKIQETIKPAQDKIPLLSIHGNILYNFSYRSYIDTPFAESNLMQHLVQTNLNFLIKGKYPLRMTISHRNSNSPYFKNATDINFEFNRNQLLNNIKADLNNKIPRLVNIEKLTREEQLYKAKLNEVRELQAWINNPARIQEFVEEKERAIQANIPAPPTIADLKNKFPSSAGAKDWNAATLFYERKSTIKGSVKNGNYTSPINDSLQSIVKDKIPDTAKTALEKFNAKKQELLKLQATLKEHEAAIKNKKKNVQDSIAKMRQEINSLNSGAGLYAFMKRHHISKDSLTKAQRLLLSVNKVGIGRSWVDYSELTVKNISLTGVNIEMNPAPYYIAVAAGKLNYRFRDFILKDNKTIPNQSLYLVRAGIGQKEKNNLIFTFYNGKKEILNTTPGINPFSLQKVLGVSAEARIALDANNYIIAELAKSSYGNNTTPQPAQSALLNKAFNWRVHSNEAYSIKLFSQYPQTDTRITGYYRKTGEDFQSFNLYPIGSNQEAWMARVNQAFWKRKFTIDAAIRKNDFISPIAAPSFASKTIFKSFQATVRIPHYPFVSVGYYPSSQLSLSNNNILTESQYNTLNTVVSHSYNIKKIIMNTNAVYTKFYNNSSDTAFIYFNATSWTVNHSVFLSALTLQSSISLTEQKDLHLVTLEQLLAYQFRSKLTVSGSLKWNRLNKKEDMFGGTAAISVYIRKIGTLQFNYDKAYLPGYNRVLVPVDIGRMSFYRDF